MLETQVNDVQPAVLQTVASIPGVRVLYKKSADLYQVMVDRKLVDAAPLEQIKHLLKSADLSFEILA